MVHSLDDFVHISFNHHPNHASLREVAGIVCMTSSLQVPSRTFYVESSLANFSLSLLRILENPRSLVITSLTLRLRFIFNRERTSVSPNLRRDRRKKQSTPSRRRNGTNLSPLRSSLRRIVVKLSSRKLRVPKSPLTTSRGVLLNSLSPTSITMRQ